MDYKVDLKHLLKHIPVFSNSGREANLSKIKVTNQ